MEYMGQIMNLYEQYIAENHLPVLRLTPEQQEKNSAHQLITNWIAQLE